MISNLNAVQCWIRPTDGKKNAIWGTVADDEILRFLVRVWASKSTSFCVIFRSIDQPSPNSIQVGEMTQTFVKMTISDALNQIEPFTQEKVEKLHDGDAVIIANETVKLCVSGENLFEYIKVEQSKGIAPTDIELTVDDVKIRLDDNVWVTCLTRANKCKPLELILDRKDFVLILSNTSRNLIIYQKELNKLHTVKSDLWNRLKVFVNDLVKFGDNENAKKRLETNTSLYYLSTDYFTEHESSYILSFPSATGLSLKQLLEVKFKESVDQEICSSHDIAPVFQTVFNIRKGFQNEKIFNTFKAAFEKKYKASSKSPMKVLRK